MLVLSLMQTEVICAVIQPLKVHLRADEEVGQHIVALGPVIAQTYLVTFVLTFCRSFQRIEAPLNHVLGVGKLLADRVLAHRCTVLIIFRVANVIDGSLFACRQQNVVYPEVVHNLSVALVGQPLGQQGAIGANQFVDDGLENDVEVLHQDILLVAHLHFHFWA